MGNNYENEGSSAATKLTFLIIGGGIGAVLALLFAPKSGVELREDIADATRKGIEKSKEAAAQIQDRAGEYYEATRERAADILETRTRKGGRSDREGQVGRRKHCKSFLGRDRGRQSRPTPPRSVKTSQSPSPRDVPIGVRVKRPAASNDILDTGDGENKG